MEIDYNFGDGSFLPVFFPDNSKKEDEGSLVMPDSHDEPDVPTSPIIV